MKKIVSLTLLCTIINLHLFAEPKIEISPKIDTFKPNQRIKISANIKDNSGINAWLNYISNQER